MSTKDRHIKGLWTIVDWHEGVETSSTIWLKNSNNNKALHTEATVALDLVAAVVHSMRGFDEGKIKMHMDFRKFWYLLTTKVMKASQLAGDRGSII